MNSDQIKKKTKEEIFGELKSSPDGLSGEEAKKGLSNMGLMRSKKKKLTRS